VVTGHCNRRSLASAVIFFILFPSIAGIYRHQRISISAELALWRWRATFCCLEIASSGAHIKRKGRVAKRKLRQTVSRGTARPVGAWRSGGCHFPVEERLEMAWPGDEIKIIHNIKHEVVLKMRMG